MDFDIESITGLAQGARDAGTAIRDVSTAFAAFKGMLKPAERRSDGDIEAAAKQVTLAMKNADLQNRLLEAQVSLFVQKLRDMEKAQAKLDDYALYRTPAGSIVYAQKNVEGGAENGHFICPDCYEDARRSILQINNQIGVCGRCKRAFTIYDRAQSANARPRVGWMGA